MNSEMPCEWDLSLDRKYIFELYKSYFHGLHEILHSIFRAAVF